MSEQTHAERVEVAYHEAGHAVAAHVLGLPIAGVTVEKTDDFLGAAWVGSNALDANLAKAIVIALAGGAAERNLLGIKKPTGCEDDARKVTKYYDAMTKQARVTKRAIPTIKELGTRTDALVLKYRRHITNLAACLMGCGGSLDGPTVHRALAHAINPPPPPPPQPIRKRSQAPLFEPRQQSKFAKRLRTSTDTLWKYRPDQTRDAGGRFADEGKGGADGGGGWQRAARIAGMAAFGIASVGGAAVAVRTGNASAALHLATHGRGMMAAAARVKGGSKVSRSLLESSAYNLSNVRASLGLVPYQYELARRFAGASTSVRFGRDTGTGLSGVIISVRSGTVSAEAVAAGRVPSNVFLGEAILAENAILGRTLMVGNLYAPATAAGALFSREYMNVVMRTAIANRVNDIRTFAGSSMGGFLWPQRGFELAVPKGDIAQALRRTIATRAGQMLDGGAITKTQYDDIASTVANWGKDVPTRLAHMDTKVAVGGLKLKDFPALDAIRGDMTIGKALLAGTNGFYVLPKAKYESLVTITKSARVPIATRIQQSATAAFL